jgi:hypothetical protein
MTDQPGYQRGDRIAVEYTADPHTRLRSGDEGTVTGYDPKPGQLGVRWDSGSTLAMLLDDGDRVRLIPSAREHPGQDGGRPQDITDPATGLSRLMSVRCSTCILRHGDKMHLGAEYTAAFVRQALDAGTYVVCHQTLTYGDHPEFGPAICRGFFDAYADRSPALGLLQAFSRLTEVEPPQPEAGTR